MGKFERIFILGDVNHVFNIGFFKALRKLIPETKIDVLSSNEALRENHHALVDSHGCSTPKGFLTKISAFRYALRLLLASFFLFKHSILKNRKKHDLTILQGGLLWFSAIVPILKRTSSKLFVALWGSDFYKCRNHSKLLKLLHAADVISVGSEKMLLDLVQTFPDLEGKVHVCYFGITGANKLQSNTGKQHSNTTKIIVGNNGSRNNQHLEILSTIDKIVGDVPSLEIIVPLTYGLQEDYKQEILLFIQHSELNIHPIFNFLSDEENAALKHSASLYIHLPLNDAFSASMREFLYLQKPVITGNWLPYNELLNKDYNIHLIEEIQHLEKAVKEVLNQQQDRSFLPLDEKYVFWDKAILDWQKHF